MKKTWTIGLLGLFVVTLLSQCTPKKQEVSQWRGPNRDGFYPEKNLLKEWPENGPELLWQYDSLGKGYSSAAIADGITYTAGTEDSITSLFAFNLDGSIKWKKTLGEEWIKTFPGARTTPLIIRDKGYIFSGLGVLYCFDCEKGDILWNIDFMTDYEAKNIMHGITENLIASGDTLFCTPGAKEANVVAVNRHTGDFYWKSEAAGGLNAYCSPILIPRSDKNILVTMTFNELIALDASNGNLLWSKELKEAKYGIHANTPQFYKDYLFNIEGWSYGSYLLKLSNDGKTYEEIWKNDSLDPQLGDAIRMDENLYASSGSKNEWYCVDFQTGKLKSVNDELGTGIILSSDDMLYLYTYSGKMALAKPTQDGFDIISQFQVGSKKKDHFSYPVIKDGRLYIRHNNQMFVYDIAKKA